MTSQPVAILASGMVTGVGLTSAASSAAIRCAINNFTETRFLDRGGEWVIGSQVPLEQPWRGTEKLLRMVVPAIQECLDQIQGVPTASIPLLFCVAERERPGRMAGVEKELFARVVTTLGARFHPESAIFAEGRVAGVVALDYARKLIRDGRVQLCLIAGVDSYLVGSTLAAYEERRRLLTSKNSDGFIPGEAGTAVLLGILPDNSRSQLCCRAVGFGRERATVETGEPLRADGLVAAFRAMTQDGGVTLDDADYRYTDCNGEQYGFKEDRLAISRVLRKLKARFDHLHPADCIGEVGAAVGPCVLGLALSGNQKQYAPGPSVLCHFGNDEGMRAAILLGSVPRIDLNE